MDVIHDTNDEQAQMWNGPSGRAWVENQDLLDRMYEPFEDLLVEAVFANPPAPCSTWDAAPAPRRSPSREPWARLKPRPTYKESTSRSR